MHAFSVEILPFNIQYAVLTCGGHYHGQCGVGHAAGSSIKQFTKIQSLAGKIKQVCVRFSDCDSMQ